MKFIEFMLLFSIGFVVSHYHPITTLPYWYITTLIFILYLFADFNKN